MKSVRRFLALVFLIAPAVHAAQWQWSVPLGEGRAFLWIPPECDRVRAVVVGQHNMLEEGVLEHPIMRRELSALGIAEVFIAPPFDRVFQFDQEAGERFTALLKALADQSGYDELATSPVVAIGHSACASYPWNFAAWNPARTLAVISLKGDAPRTDLTGSGRPNPDWGKRSIDGIPGVMVMSEAEWWEARLAPLQRFRAAHPRAPIGLLADVGRGHFDASDRLVEWLAMFIRKAAEARLPAEGSDALRDVEPDRGWLVDRWHAGESPSAPPAPFAEYTGSRAEAFWCFDEEIARATEALYAIGRDGEAQQVDFVQAGALAPISTSHAGVELEFQPATDGLTFRLSGAFIAPLPARPPTAAKDTPPPPTTTVPSWATTGSHASGPVVLSRIVGPVIQVAPDTFALQPNRTWMAMASDRRRNDIWLLASLPGDTQYKGAVQQALLRAPAGTVGTAQVITFPEIADQLAGAVLVPLDATSNCGLPVRYFVCDGPAEIDGAAVRITAIPPRALFPLIVTVVAWQWGRGGAEPVAAAQPVARSFRISR